MISQREVARRKLNVPLVLPVTATQVYVAANTLVLSGISTPLALALAAGAWLFARWAQGKRPKLLVLRRFGDTEVDTFLRIAAGGLGMHARAIWLYDQRVPHSYRIRKYTPDAWALIALPLSWIAVGLAIVGRVPGNLAYEVLWLAWIVASSLTYHRYKAGQSPNVWLGCVGALLVTIAAREPLRSVFPSLKTAPWHDAAAFATLFLMSWLLASLLLQIPLIRRPFHWMYRSRVLATEADLAQFVHDLQGKAWVPRFLSIAPIHVAEIVCHPGLWADAVYESIGYSSVAIADVSRLDDKAPLRWELQEARHAGMPVLITCSADSAIESKSALAEMGFHATDIFVWRRDPLSPWRISYDPDDLSARYFNLVRGHLGEELIYLPLRRSRAEAVARWKERHNG